MQTIAKKLPRILVAASAVLFTVSIADAGRCDARSDFNGRLAQLRNYLNTREPNYNQRGRGPHRIGRTGFFFADARFQKGDLARGLQMVRAAVIDATAEGANAGFSAWPGIDCYIRWNDLFDDALKAQFRAVYTQFKGFRGGVTANQRMMLATARYLATQVWGASAFVAGSEANYGTSDPTGKAYVQNVILATPRKGLDEHDSTTYTQFHAHPMLSVADLSTDPVLARRARMAYYWTVIEGAAAWGNSHWATASDRGGQGRGGNQYASSEFPYWLCFGGVPPSSLLDACISAYMAHPDYVIPDVVLYAGSDRSSTVRRRSLAIRNNIGYYKTSYIANKYNVFSQFENNVRINADGTVTLVNRDTRRNDDPHQMMRWGISWEDNSSRGTVLRLTNPWMPSSPGSTEFENVAQNDGTLIAVYNIPTSSTVPDWLHGGRAKTNYQQVNGEIPTGYLACIDETSAPDGGRLYLHYNNVLIALALTSPFPWSGGSFSLPANRLGLAVETAAVSDYLGATPEERLIAFYNDIQQNSFLDADAIQADPPVLTYTDRNGDTLQMVYRVDRFVNGVSIDDSSWPMIENPFLSMPVNDTLVVAYGDDERRYDFSLWAYTPEPPGSVVAAPAGNNSIRLGWKSVSRNETAYVIERSPDGVGSWETVGVVGADTLQYVDTGLAPDTDYFYRITGIDQSLSSPPSRVVSGRV